MGQPGLDMNLLKLARNAVVEMLRGQKQVPGALL